ncbi:teichoic acid glycosyl transferase [Companilactobacillus crustorum]|uniref:teichoic acid glycosyl transferase n=1 Tax=Companilactobacillus crustorum TaxID=392416 RepID=UPI00096A4F9C|nr:teichoic acid glycosyl transferase [Companilactobacillus crustorum]HCD07773.1 teichoic acid glycosyl transferase [Lactobacillus sp.]
MKLDKTLLKKCVLPVLILFLACLFTMGSSVLFRTNPWVDCNAMLTMGKSVLHGLVPYRDVIDQRGPFLYLVFAMGAAIKQTSFLGVFIMQLFNVGIIYWLSLKIAKDFKITLVKPQWAALLGPLALMVTAAFSYSGAPEEFAFPSVLYLLYVLNHYRQDITKIPLKTYFLLGINLSLIFWNKFSMVGSYAVFFLLVAGIFLHQKQFKNLLKVIIASISGFLAVSLIFLLYYAVQHSLGDLFQIYFVQNINSYGQTNQSTLSKLWSLLFLIGKEFRVFALSILVIVAGWIKAIYDNKPVAIEISMFLGAVLFVALQHRVNYYYVLIWMPFLAMALLRLLQFNIPKMNHSNKISLNLLIVTCLIAIPFANNLDLQQLIVKGDGTSYSYESNLAQRKFSNIIKNQKTKNHQPSLLMVNDLDKGFFLAADILPTTRYWQKLNMNYEELPQMYHSFNDYLAHKKVDFVIVSVPGVAASNIGTVKDQVSAVIDPHIRQSLFANYQMKSVASNGPDVYYVLYYRK